MRRIFANMFVTMDGIMQAPGSPREDTSGGFRWGGWTVRYWDDMMDKVMSKEVVGKQFDMLLGRKTYDIFSAYWPYAPHEPGTRDAKIFERFRDATKYVVSRTLSKPSWKESVIISGDVVNEIRKLKSCSGREIQVYGSSELLQTLLREDLLDCLKIWTFPITIGTGKRLFGEGTVPAGFRLRDCKASKTGVIIADYERSGDIKTGSFDLEKTPPAELERRKNAEEEGDEDE